MLQKFQKFFIFQEVIVLTSNGVHVLEFVSLYKLTHSNPFSHIGLLLVMGAHQALSTSEPLYLLAPLAGMFCQLFAMLIF